MTASFILMNLRILKWRLQFTAKASIYSYTYTSRQSVVKQGYQKTHFPILLKLETFFAVDLVKV